MSQDRVFSIIGDSNVNRFTTNVNQRSCSDLASSQVISCGRIQVLAEALKRVRTESNVCIISCVTNFICDATGSGEVGPRVEPVIKEFRRIVTESCADNLSRKFCVCPPMFRTTPEWYSDGLPEVLQSFSTMLSTTRPSNLFLLPSFATPAFDPDGVHLTQYSGV